MLGEVRIRADIRGQFRIPVKTIATVSETGWLIDGDCIIWQLEDEGITIQNHHLIRTLREGRKKKKNS